MPLWDAEGTAWDMETAPGDDAGAVSLGAAWLPGDACQFTVWAPYARRVDVELLDGTPRRVPMEPADDGYFTVRVNRVSVGSLYMYRLNGSERLPDPASRYQPRGVHGPSAVVDVASFPWPDDGWSALPLDDWVVYELHVGTFTPEGTFDAVIPHLDRLRDLGVTVIELMPTAQFPGARNWGYDGVFPFAVQDTYGGPHGLQRLVAACHARGMAVVLDVVYNHLGPEGNVLGRFGPYFTDAYRTPWGKAVNFDGPGSDGVRRYFRENARYWAERFRMDGLRLDAVHAIYDRSARPFLAELADDMVRHRRRTGRDVILIAESDLNDPRILAARSRGGCGMDGQWNDDFHHSLHRVLTGERHGYYKDYPGVASLGRAFIDGFVYTGQRSEHRGRRHGAPASDVEAHRLVVFAQNHDQVGNRAAGERLTQLVDRPRLKLAASAVLLSPFTPLLFMGEEYGEPAPFLYFTDHSDPQLVEAVRRGRQEEFGEGAGGEYDVHDPQDPETFARSRPQWGRAQAEPHRRLLAFYKELLALRRRINHLVGRDRRRMEAVTTEDPARLLLRRWGRGGWAQVLTVFNFAAEPFEFTVPPPGWPLALVLSKERTPAGPTEPWTVWLDSVRSSSESAVQAARSDDGSGDVQDTRGAVSLSPGEKLVCHPTSVIVLAAREGRRTGRESPRRAPSEVFLSI